MRGSAIESLFVMTLKSGSSLLSLVNNLFFGRSLKEKSLLARGVRVPAPQGYAE